jgi:uncharacterized protein YdeI (YjbR/CyaY-like superfamily)
MSATYFASPAELRRWLAKNHGAKREVLIGFYKKGAKKKGVTYQEALDEALCFGWIDGVRKSVDDARYTIRFTPRKARSNWSEVNIARVAELKAAGRMEEPGLRAFESYNPEKTRAYAYEARATATLDPGHERELRANARAWKFFEAQAPSYQRVAKYWIATAKQDETKRPRLAKLIECSEDGERLPQYVSPGRREKKS